MNDADPECPASEGAAGEQETVAGALAARVVLSAAAIALCGVLAWLATELVAGSPGRARLPAEGGASASGLPSVPVPQGSEMTFDFGRDGGRHVRYESRLSMEEIDRFYVRNLSDEGWNMDASLGPGAWPEGPPRVVKTFTRGTARCIISAESKGRSGTAVTILLVRRSGKRNQIAPEAADRLRAR